MSYKDSFAFYFSLNCIITSIICLQVHLAVTQLPYSAWLARIKAKVPMIPIRSYYMVMFLAGLYAGFLLLISPLMAFLFLGHQTVFPLIRTALLGGILTVCITLMTTTRSPLALVVSSMSLIEIAFCLSQLIQMFSMFDYIPEQLVLLVSLASSIPFWGLIVYLSTQKDLISFSRSTWFLSAIVATILVASLGYLMAGACVAPFGEALSGPKIFFSDSMFINTRAVRTRYCMDPVCHVYLTAGEDLTTSVFINAHSYKQSKSMSVKFVGEDRIIESKQVRATELSGLDSQDDRNVFYTFLPDLVPGKDYEFSIIIDSQDHPTVYRFRLPRGNSSIRMSIGGDAGVTFTSRKILQLMYASNPDLIVIGGDMAYDNGIAACACLWDAFLEMLDHRTPDGRLVPITFAVGNHDIGYNHANEGGWQAKKNPLPLLLTWFPHVGESLNRRHRFGDIMNLWILDSDYTTSLEEVVEFVDSSLATRETKDSTVNIGVYHVPIYSVHIYDYHRGDELRNVWPKEIFDKHKFYVNFENHSHLYKRTKPLIDSHEGPGTVYLGDGNIGVSEDMEEAGELLQKSDDRFEANGVDFHFFSVTVSLGGHVVVDAINPLGKVIDHLEIHGYGNVTNSQN